MEYTFRFQKILELKENEKDLRLTEYNRSVKDFETAAEKLYESMKKKEVLEENTKKQLKNGMAVQAIRHYQQFVTNLDRTIEYYQKLVMISRNNMKEKQEVLMESNSEVRKFEKMKERHNELNREIEKQNDSRSMDDLSIRSYMYREI
ncbi:flagellar biosynthesis chaperone FliJ [Bacillus sp. FJAT-42376]|uniref:flagellar export protein FliJ n=1 Tax=Bacillus sp. FJAT-42376 TaxID=2014076 RepID=UPI000F50C77B|nr:flagellar export protein FliJ [Bacillus sp. FJAT-42376]AZB44840.1 flagellar biosynthesis chaperone FliJ [Bacillus sp. FJAT-42376]